MPFEPKTVAFPALRTRSVSSVKKVRRFDICLSTFCLINRQTSVTSFSISSSLYETSLLSVSYSQRQVMAPFAAISRNSFPPSAPTTSTSTVLSLSRLRPSSTIGTIHSSGIKSTTPSPNPHRLPNPYYLLSYKPYGCIIRVASQIHLNIAST